MMKSSIFAIATLGVLATFVACSGETTDNNGKPGGMSATAHKSKALSPNQIEDVIAYVRSIRG